jgi:hypothetical protein
MSLQYFRQEMMAACTKVVAAVVVRNAQIPGVF